MANALVFTDAYEAVLAVVDGDPLDREASRFRPARPASGFARQGGSGTWPIEYDLGSRSQAALFHLVALVGPELVVETGVAAGASSTQILNALADRGSGSLLSIDVTPNVGELIPLEVRDRWSLEVLPERGRKKAFRDILASHSGYRIFFHDSDHSEKWQRFEYEAASDFAGPNAIICSDDVEASPAFVDFCVSRRLRPILLLDGLKVMGLARLAG
jgi:predicted O-methyltransferase YrrM